MPTERERFPAAIRHGMTMTDPDTPKPPLDLLPRTGPPTMEELLKENERLRVELALHKYFSGLDNFKKKVPRKKPRRSKR